MKAGVHSAEGERRRGGATSGPRGRRGTVARCGGAVGALVAPTPHCWGAVSQDWRAWVMSGRQSSEARAGTGWAVT